MLFGGWNRIQSPERESNSEAQLGAVEVVSEQECGNKGASGLMNQNGISHIKEYLGFCGKLPSSYTSSLNQIFVVYAVRFLLMFLVLPKHLGEHFLRRKSFRLFHSIEESLVTTLDIDHELSFTLLVITDPAKVKVLEFQFLASLINQVLGNFGEGSIGPTFIPHLIHLQEEEFLSRLLEFLVVPTLMIAIIDVMMRIVVVSHLVQKGFQDISDRTIQGLGTDRDLMVFIFAVHPRPCKAPSQDGFTTTAAHNIENGRW